MNESRRRVGTSLLRDPLIQTALLLVVGTGVASFSGVAQEWRISFYGTTILLAMVLVALFRGRRNAERLERRFWDDLAIAFGAWLAVDLLISPFPIDAIMPLPIVVLMELGYGMYVVFVFLAFERRPDLSVAGAIDGRERVFRIPTVAVFVFGLVVYFALTPAIYNRPVYEARDPSYYLYFLLDLFLAGRLAWLTHASANRRWRMLYAGFTMYFLVNITVNVNVLLDLVKFAYAWEMPLLMALVVICMGRVHYEELPGSGMDAEKKKSGFDLSLMQTFFYALMFPLLHFTFYSVGALDEPSKPARELLIAVWMLLIGAVAILQLWFVQRSRKKIGAEIAWRRRLKTERKRYLRMISEDLEKPLTSLDDSLGSLRQSLDLQDSKQADEDLGQIRDAVETLRFLLDELVDGYENGTLRSGSSTF